MTNTNSFGKGEKLKSRKQIDELFASGQSFFIHPLKVYWKLEPQNSKESSAVNAEVAKAGVSASKRNFKKAVHRNRVKRLLRETYRLNKKSLITACATQNCSLLVFFIYVDKSMPTFEFLEERMKSCIRKLEKISRIRP